MLELYLNDTIIPIPADFSMELVVNSPFCNFDKIPFCYSLDVLIPVNEYTAIVLGHPDRFGKLRNGNDQKFPGLEIKMDGILLLAGTLKINGLQGTNYDCTIIDPCGVLSEAQQNKTLHDLSAFQKEIAWLNSSNYDADESPYCCFPVNNQNFFKDKGVVIHRKDKFSDPASGGDISDYEYDIELLKYIHQQTGSGQQNARNDDGTIKAEANTIDATNLVQKTNTYSTGKVNVVSPFFFLKWIIKEALKESLFFQLTNYLEQNDDLKKVCVFNTFDLTQMSFVKKGGLIWEYDTSNTTEIFPDSIYSQGLEIVKFVRSYPASFKPVNHLPKMSIGEMLVSTQNLFNVVFDFLPNRRYRILSREEILKSEAFDLDKYAIGQWEPSSMKDTALKFTREIESNDLIFSEKFTDLTDRRGDIKDPVTVWEELEDIILIKEEGDIRQISTSKIFAEYKWYTPETIADGTKTVQTTDVLGWKQISIGLQNGWYNYGKDEIEEIASKFGVCYGFGSVVSVLQQGNMNVWKSKQQAFSPRLLLYRGENMGGIETETLSLDYENEKIGLLIKLWGNTKKWMSSRLPVTRKFDFPVNMLHYLIFNKCAKYRTTEGTFIPDEIRCTLFVDHISETTIKGYKV